MAKNEVKKEVKESKAKKHFFKDFKAELKKVIWPTPKQLINNTVAVVVIVLIVSVIVLVLDSIFKFGNEYGIKNLQSLVKENFSQEEVIEESTENNTEETVEGENTETNVETENIEIEETDTVENNSNVEE